MLNFIETRAAPEDDPGNADPVTEFRAALDTFTATATERLGGIETRMDALTTRLDTVERIARRPGAAPEHRQNAGEIERRAYVAYLRYGVERMAAEEQRALTVSTDTAGGYLVPQQFVAEIVKNLVQFSPVRQYARVATASASEILLPKRTGTMTAAWVAETGNRSSTQPAYGQQTLTVYELACYTDISNQLLEDAAFDMAAELSADFAEQFGKAEGTAFIAGDGSGKPTGIVADTNFVTATTAGASKIGADDLIDLFHAVASPYAANGVWMMNRRTMGAIRKLKTSDGIYLLQMSGIAGAPSVTLLGRPVVEAPDLADVADDAVPVVFGDFSNGFRIFDRLALSVLRDPYSIATSGQTRFHARRRVAAGLVKAEALVGLKIKAA